MAIDLKKISAAVEAAAKIGQANPEGDVGQIVNEVVGELGTDYSNETLETRGLAQKWLDTAAEDVEAQGESVERARNAALVGIGYALLAAGIDAEVFYSMFSSGEAKIDVLGQP